MFPKVFFPCSRRIFFFLHAHFFVYLMDVLGARWVHAFKCVLNIWSPENCEELPLIFDWIWEKLHERFLLVPVLASTLLYLSYAVHALLNLVRNSVTDTGRWIIQQKLSFAHFCVLKLWLRFLLNNKLYILSFLSFRLWRSCSTNSIVCWMLLFRKNWKKKTKTIPRHIWIKLFFLSGINFLNSEKFCGDYLDFCFLWDKCVFCLSGEKNHICFCSVVWI